MTQERIDTEATEEAGSVPVSEERAATYKKEDRRGFLGSARRNLSEEEAASPAGRRWLIAEVERLDQECDRLREVHAQNSSLEVQIAKLEERQKTSRALELVTFVSSAIGSAGIGAAPSYMTVAHLNGVGWVFLIGSSLLLLCGICSKVIKW